jgi:hypothetical protein
MEDEESSFNSLLDTYSRFQSTSTRLELDSLASRILHQWNEAEKPQVEQILADSLQNYNFPKNIPWIDNTRRSSIKLNSYSTLGQALSAAKDMELHANFLLDEARILANQRKHSLAEVHQQQPNCIPADEEELNPSKKRIQKKESGFASAKDCYLDEVKNFQFSRLVMNHSRFFRVDHLRNIK